MEKELKRHQGKLIVFEGIDGCGKSTQAKMLCERIKNEGKNAILRFEPTKEGYGKKLRDSFNGERFSLETEYEYFTLDRKDHLKNHILPALKEGTHVVLDRYFYSTAAYQGARGLNPGQILSDQKSFAYTPDKLFLIVIDVEEAVKRIKDSRGKTNSFEDKRYLEDAAHIFSQMHEGQELIDGSLPIDEMHNALFAQTAQILDA